MNLEVQNFFTHHTLATIATKASENRYPHVTPLFYVTDENLHLYFMSHENSEKLKKILSNPRITVSITDQSTITTLQLKGVTTAIEDSPKKIEVMEKIIRVSNDASNNSFPPITKLSGGPLHVYEFTPQWFQYSNFSGKEAVIYKDGLDNLLL